MSAPDDRILCYCKNVRYGEVRAAIDRTSARTVADVMKACDAGTGCRTCHPEIEDLLVERRAKQGGLVALLKKIFAR